MEGVESFKGERCGIDNCRSRRYHLTDEGTYECGNGHIHAEIRAQGEDEDVFRGAASGRITRTDSGSELREKVSKHFTGRKGFELFLQCYQLVLRKQCQFLIGSQQCPDEIETVARDLWTSRIQHLSERIDDTNTIASDSESQSQVFSSQSENDDATIASTSSKSRATPRMVDTLALIYTACVLLRLPILPSDLHRWANEGDLLYYAARKETPKDMLARLPGTYHSLLDPRKILSISALNAAVKDMALFYQRDIGMRIPPLNLPPLLLRCMKELVLPLPIYDAVNELKHIVGFNFDYADWDEGSGTRVMQASPPTSQLAAAIVVATKLLYPFDDVERHPVSASDPAVLAVDWAKWTEVVRLTKGEKVSGKQPMDFENAMALQERDAWSLSDGQLDDYMAWYASMWASEEVDEHANDAGTRKELFGMFPMPEFPMKRQDAGREDIGDEGIGRVKAMMASLRVIEPVADGERDVPRPGSFYKNWRVEEDLNEHARAFCEEVCRVVGISLYRLIRAVFYTEGRLYRWSEDLRRAAG